MAALRSAAGPSLFKRFFGLIENQPLYVMVGIACGLAVYTPIRHITHAPDIALGASERDAAAGYEEGAQAGSGRTLEKAWQYRSGGVLAKAARLNEYVHVIPDYGVPDKSHFEWKKGKKILDVRDMPMPQPE